MVSSIHRIQRSVAPEPERMPRSTSPPQGGGIGAQRVQREPATRGVWGMTVRYDNGQFGLVTLDSEPDFRVGDRVRRVGNTFEPIAQPAR